MIMAEASVSNQAQPIEGEPVSQAIAVVPQRGAAKRAAATLSTQLLTKPRRMSKKNSEASLVSNATAQGGSEFAMELDQGSNSSSNGALAAEVASISKRPKVARTYGKKSASRSHRNSAYSAINRSAAATSLSPPPSLTESSSGRLNTHNGYSQQLDMPPSDSTANPSPSKRRRIATAESKLSRSHATRNGSARGTNGRNTTSRRPPIYGPSTSSSLVQRIDGMEISSHTATGPVILRWARVNMDGDSVPCDDPAGFWWPCEVIGSFGLDTTSVALLGDPPSRDSSKPTRTITCTSNSTLPFRSKQGICFDHSNFDQGYQSPDNAIVAGTSQSRHSLLDRWRIAMEKALLKDQRENDGLPDISFLASSQEIVPTLHSGGSSQPLDANDSSLTPGPEEIWKPDSELHIGATGLCRAKAGSSTYWPAKIESHHPSKNGNLGRYGVIFNDGTTKRIPREWWVTQTSNEFLTCELGEYEKQPEDEEDDGRKSPLPRRSPSPIPSSEAPDDNTFTEFNLRLQVAHVRPVLDLIIKGEYRWALPRHDAFMAGGIKRGKLSEAVHLGDLSQDDVGDVMREIRRWALRGERWGQTVEDNDTEDRFDEHPAPRSSIDGFALVDPVLLTQDDWANIPSDRIPRLCGGPEYETLKPSERSQYCTDVLLPEALLQLFILRRGLRSGPIPNPDDTYEHDLYTSASQAWAEEKWVGLWADMVISTRQERRRRKGLPATDSKDKSEEQSLVKGTTRSKRIYA
ncbi:hypothetical protein FRB94_000863 [Tulasnella sp. JGI-2019a]|nr:hypothetical protein FRB93_004354 [Tulasnella sp. JGI-2019a]KAG9006238.1 hypothetical protein FRB94_000863 [Tulasnella sp. JGI-2019a]KAG9039455.1 hypothetical protein FRB95_010744 [Tulasnella sp. JGI-2019a]